jgi:hypothetical protein
VRTELLPLCLLALLASPLQAQNPDLMLTQAERDSLLATYDNIFPIWGRKAIEKGFDLPKPFGVNLIGAYIDQGIAISDLGLSTGSNPIVPIDAIKFGDNTSTVGTLNARAELWVLPFLNVYAIGGTARANTTVEVTTPVAFTSSVDQLGTYFGTGLTGAFGIKRNFLSVDVNWTWTDLEKMDEAVRGRVLSLRFGRTLKMGPQKRLAFWVGAMNVKLVTETQGSLTLAEAVPPGTVDDIQNFLQNIDQTAWYQGLNPGQQVVVDQIVQRLLSSSPGSIQVNYRINKSPADPWNMLVGSNYDFNKRWSVRAEVGMIGRFSVLTSLVYRMDL